MSENAELVQFSNRKFDEHLAALLGTSLDDLRDESGGLALDNPWGARVLEDHVPLDEWADGEADEQADSGADGQAGDGQS